MFPRASRIIHLQWVIIRPASHKRQAKDFHLPLQTLLQQQPLLIRHLLPYPHPHWFLLDWHLQQQLRSHPLLLRRHLLKQRTQERLLLGQQVLLNLQALLRVLQGDSPAIRITLIIYGC